MKNNLMVKIIKLLTITLFLFITAVQSKLTFPKFPDDFEQIITLPSRIQPSVGNTKVGLVYGASYFFLKNAIHGGLDEEGTKEIIVHNIAHPSKITITQVSVGYDDSVWAINKGIEKGTNVFHLPKLAMYPWEKKTGNLIHISVGLSKPNYMWGVNKKGELLYWRQKNKEEEWAQHKRPYNKPLKQVSCGCDRELWVIGKDDDSVWRWDKNKWVRVKNPPPPRRRLKDAQGLPITLTQVDVGDKDHVVGIDNNNVAKIYDPSSKKWEIIGEGIKNISINKDGDIWLVTTKCVVYRGTFRVKLD